jgi:ATP-dependent DNA helicase HFM1/MER3
LTGDTTSVDVADIRLYNLILTTPEKWDSLTRKWKDHNGLVHMHYHQPLRNN